MFAPLKESIIGRAQAEGKISIEIVNIRDFAENKHFKCDDYPFGGGAGMVMMPQPIGSAIEAVDHPGCRPPSRGKKNLSFAKGTDFYAKQSFRTYGL